MSGSSELDITPATKDGFFTPPQVMSPRGLEVMQDANTDYKGIKRRQEDQSLGPYQKAPSRSPRSELADRTLELQSVPKQQIKIIHMIERFATTIQRDEDTVVNALQKYHKEHHAQLMTYKRAAGLRDTSQDAKEADEQLRLQAELRTANAQLDYARSELHQAAHTAHVYEQDAARVRSLAHDFDQDMKRRAMEMCKSEAVAINNVRTHAESEISSWKRSYQHVCGQVQHVAGQRDAVYSELKQDRATIEEQFKKLQGSTSKHLDEANKRTFEVLKHEQNLQKQLLVFESELSVEQRVKNEVLSEYQQSTFREKAHKDGIQKYINTVKQLTSENERLTHDNQELQNKVKAYAENTSQQMDAGGVPCPPTVPETPSSGPVSFSPSGQMPVTPEVKKPVFSPLTPRVEEEQDNPDTGNKYGVTPGFGSGDALLSDSDDPWLTNDPWINVMKDQSSLEGPPPLPDIPDFKWEIVDGQMGSGNTPDKTLGPSDTQITKETSKPVIPKLALGGPGGGDSPPSSHSGSGRNPLVPDSTPPSQPRNKLGMEIVVKRLAAGGSGPPDDPPDEEPSDHGEDGSSRLPTPRKGKDPPPPPYRPPPGLDPPTPPSGKKNGDGSDSDGDKNQPFRQSRARSITPPRTPKKDGLDGPLNKHKDLLPKLILPDNYSTAPPHIVRQKFEEWIAQTSMVMATWHAQGQYWWKLKVKEAREEHETWVGMTESEKGRYESKYMWGEQIEIPSAPNGLEAILRTTIIKVVPAALIEDAFKLGYHGTQKILYLVMKKIMPSTEYTRIGIGRSLLLYPRDPIFSLHKAITWLDDFMTKIKIATMVNCKFENRQLYEVFETALQNVVKQDFSLQLKWEQMSIQYNVRTPHLTLKSIQEFTSLMIVEMRMLRDRWCEAIGARGTKYGSCNYAR